MPCGDNRILTMLFDYLTDRAIALGETVVSDGVVIASEDGMQRALTESRPVLDEIAALLDVDVKPLHTITLSATRT